MIDQRNKNLTFKESISEYFGGSLSFDGYSSRKGHWIPVATIYTGLFTIFLLIVTITIASLSASTRYYNSYNILYNYNNIYSLILNSAGFIFIVGLIFIIIFFILLLPLTASFFRRLRDVGFSNWGIIILTTIFYIFFFFGNNIIFSIYNLIFIFVLMSLPQNVLETNKNDDFSKFFFRQSSEAVAYYSQFNNTFYNGQNFNQGQGFNPNNGQNFNQGQGFNPNNGQNFNQGQGFNPNNGQNFNQGQGFNPNNGQNFNQRQDFNPNNGQNFNQRQGFNPNNGQNFNQGQGFNPNSGQNFNQRQGFNPNNGQNFNQGQGFNPNNGQNFNQRQNFNTNQESKVNNNQQFDSLSEELSHESVNYSSSEFKTNSVNSSVSENNK